MSLNLLNKLSDRSNSWEEKTGSWLLIAISAYALVSYALTPALMNINPGPFVSSALIVFFNLGVMATFPFCLVIFASCTSFSFGARLVGTIAGGVFIVVAISIGNLARNEVEFPIFAVVPFWSLCASLPLLAMRFFGGMQIVFPQFNETPTSPKLSIIGMMIFTTMTALSVVLVPLASRAIEQHIAYKAGIAATGVGTLLIPVVGILMSARRPLRLSFTISIGLASLAFLLAYAVPGFQNRSWEGFCVTIIVMGGIATLTTMLAAFRLLGATLLRNRDYS